MHARLLLAAALALTASAAAAQTGTAVEAFPIDFLAPVELTVAPGQPDRVYVVEQGVVGPAFAPRVRTLALSDTEATLFLDLSGRVEVGGELGALGLAFHPDYATNGRVFVSYTADEPLRSVVSEFARAAADPLTADPESERVILEVPQPLGNHNAGQITFGPDGYLYLSLGDGGGAGDPERNGQDLTTLLGTIVRIDVDDVPDGETYGIPFSNPFAATDGPERDEIYAYGFRNPWRYGFDAESGDLWVMDVGQDDWEEINRVEVGANYGWVEAEGPECFRPGCDLSGYEPPVFSYSHSNATGGFSISGGMVYRGTAVPDLDGQVLYADYVTRKVWALDASGSAPDTTHLLTLSPGSIAAGPAAVREGPGGEAYVLMHSFNGSTRILRLDGVAVDAEAAEARPTQLALVGPNPFRERTDVAVTLQAGGAARLSVLDALGREVAVLFEGRLGAGETRRVGVEGRALPPGVYRLRLDADGGVSTRSLVRIH